MVSVGPVEGNSACAWIDWAREALGALRDDATGTANLPDQVLDDVDSYVDSLAGALCPRGDAFRWHGELHPDEIEYLANSLYNLDMRMADHDHPCSAGALPSEGRDFHVVLVEALLFALAQEGPSRAEFAEQLRPSWPAAVIGAL